MDKAFESTNDQIVQGVEVEKFMAAGVDFEDYERIAVWDNVAGGEQVVGGVVESSSCWFLIDRDTSNSLDLQTHLLAATDSGSVILSLSSKDGVAATAACGEGMVLTWRGSNPANTRK